ncbi:MAG: aspartate aminotransferase family protein [Thermoplasmatales archaeon]
MRGPSKSTDKSYAMFKDAETFLPGGVNGNIKYRDPYPLFLSRARGSHIWDIDGNDYVDYVLSYGALILGHGHHVVKNALLNVSDSLGTTLFGNPAPQEFEYAKILLDIFKKGGKLRFTNSGLEATLLSSRLAMAKTGRRKIAKFDGHYHGANPFLLANYRPKKRNESGRVDKEPDSAEIKKDLLDNITILPFNDIEGTKAALDGEEISMVILEPFEDGYIPAKRDFMDFLRKYTKENGIILCFDEVKTGLRIRLGGAVEYYGVEPDLICLGKIIGGSAPIGAVIGGREIMDLLDPRMNGNERVFHSGTFNGNPISMALGMATVNELMSNSNFEKMSQVATNLKNEISGVLDDFGIPHRIFGEGGVVNYTLSDREINTYRDISFDNLALRKKIDSAMLERGIYVIPGSRFMVSTAHTENEVNLTIESLKDALKKLEVESNFSEKGD